jgi:hypothetical protein
VNPPANSTLAECAAIPAITAADDLQYKDACGDLVTAPVSPTENLNGVDSDRTCANPCDDCSAKRKWETTVCDKPLVYEQTITVPKSTPVLDWVGPLPPPITRSCGEGPPAKDELNYTVTICGSVTIKGPVTPEDSPDPASGYDKCTDFDFNRTWSATECGVDLTNEQQITISAAAAPTFENPPGNEEKGQCVTTIPNPASLYYNDGCGKTNQGPVIVDRAVIECGGSEADWSNICADCSVSYYWSVTVCGTASHNQTITRPKDDKEPTVTPEDQDADCKDTAFPPVQPSAEDNCGVDNATWSNEDVLPCEDTSASCLTDDIFKKCYRTWKVKDTCGNEGSAVQTINVKDSADPVITCPANQAYGCTDPIPFDTASATDACGVQGVVLTPCCLEGNVLKRSWTATDKCGKTSACVQEVTISVDACAAPPG